MHDARRTAHGKYSSVRRASCRIRTPIWDSNKPNVHCSLSQAHVFNLADRCQMITADEDGFHTGILRNQATLTALLAYLADSR